jgi:hypothetical protein
LKAQSGGIPLSPSSNIKDANPMKAQPVRLPVHRTGLPGKEFSFQIVDLDPAYKAGLAVHVPVTRGE